MPPELIRLDVTEPGIAAVTLDRPERRNALSIALLDQLCSTIERLDGQPGTRVVILGGSGPVFSAGLDLTEAADDALVDRSAAAIHRTFRLLRETRLVMIAIVRGGAFAGGAGLMAACDIVIADSDARIGFPEARRGLLPALISDVLKHRVREGDLRELLLVADPIDANRARQVGLVQRIVQADRLFEEAVTIGRSILAGGPETIRRTKRLLNQTFSGSGDGQGTLESHLDARRGEEAREGLAAFTEKRKPNWI